MVVVNGVYPLIQTLHKRKVFSSKLVSLKKNLTHETPSENYQSDIIFKPRNNQKRKKYILLFDNE